MAAQMVIRYLVPGQWIEYYRSEVAIHYSRARRSLGQARQLLVAGYPDLAAEVILGACRQRNSARYMRKKAKEAEENNRLFYEEKYKGTNGKSNRK